MTAPMEGEAKEPTAEAPTAAAPAAEPPLPWYYERHRMIGLVGPVVLCVMEMWRVRQFTVDDSYISFRYARNFARGLGLVYNEGERVEGYTNFLWTLILGIGIKIGFDPVLLSKVLGGACAVGAVVLLHRLAGRIRSFTAVPCIATWLFATSAPNTGYAMFGLETSLFVFLILAGITLFLNEEPKYGGAADRFPWSGVVFGLAGLTRPEAPMYLGVFMLFLGFDIFSKRNFLRGGLFLAVVGAHLLFRHSYYGSWVPNTLGAKTGDLGNQLAGGEHYVWQWVQHTGPLSLFAGFGVLWAIAKRHRILLAVSTLAVLIVGYVILVGGDWMHDFRFLVPFEPFCFLLADVVVRDTWDWLSKGVQAKVLIPLAIIAGVAFCAFRTFRLTKMQHLILSQDDHFWKMAAGGTARLMKEYPRDTLALGDIGYVGYETDYPILDLLGLVDARIAHMPGGYTQKVGPEWLAYFFERQPRYAVIISSQHDCAHPSVYGSIVMYNDPRFRQQYKKLALTPLDGNFAWCIYERRDAIRLPQP